jgi:peptidyl-prolyl cis-trans isomerase C
LTVNQARPLALMRVLSMSALTAVCLTACGAPQDGSEGEAGRTGSGQLRFLDERASAGAPAARVGGGVISVEDVRREARARDLSEEPDALQPGDPAFREALEALIDQRLLALEAVRRRLHEAPQARQRLADAEERILGNVLMETAVADAVSDEAVRRVYEEQSRLVPPQDEVRARHILLASRDDAREVLRQIEDGADFAALARQVSLDPATRLEGGDIGYFTAAGILPEFARVAFATPRGAVSEPFQTEAGWHVLTVIDRRAQPRPSLDEMRPSIVRFLTMQRIDSLLDNIRERYPVTITAARPPSELRRPVPVETDGAGDDEADEEADAAGGDGEDAGDEPVPGPH